MTVASRALAVTLLAATSMLDGRPEAASIRAEGTCAPLDAAARRGRRIFQRGEGRAGPIEGALSVGGVSMVGRDAACANCHGRSGAGSEEEALRIPSLRPARLRASRYDRAAIGRALRAGRAPSGRALAAPMPRYPLSDADLGDLYAYLGCLGREEDPAVSPGAVRVGAALPITGPGAELGAAVRDALSASFSELAARGGVYSRRVDLVIEDTGSGGEAEAEERLIARGILALLTPLSRPEGRRAARLDEAEVVVLFPFGPTPPTPGERVFHLLPPEEMLARVAITHLAARGAAGRILVLHEAGERGERWAAEARAEARARGLPEPSSRPFARGALEAALVVEAARAEGAGALLFAGSPADAAAVTAALAALPAVMLYARLGVLGGAIDPSIRGRVLLLHAGLAPGAFAAGLRELTALLGRHGVEARHLAFQAGAALAARSLEEGLRRAGSPPTRGGLVSALKGLRDLETALAPPLSFARNRHVGVMGAHVLSLSEVHGAAADRAAWIAITP